MILSSPTSLCGATIQRVGRSSSSIAFRSLVGRIGELQTSDTVLGGFSGLLAAVVRVMAIQDAESGETGSGDLDGGFNGGPDGWGDEVP